MNGAIGQVVYAQLAGRVPQGREQEGRRPCIVIGDPPLTGRTRFGVVAVVPLTTFRAQPWQAANTLLYPVFSAGMGGISVDSVALIDQAQVVDVGRISSVIGTLSQAEYEPVEAGLRQMCDL